MHFASHRLNIILLILRIWSNKKVSLNIYLGERRESYIEGFSKNLRKTMYSEQCTQFFLDFSLYTVQCTLREDAYVYSILCCMHIKSFFDVCILIVWARKRVLCFFWRKLCKILKFWEFLHESGFQQLPCFRCNFVY